MKADVIEVVWGSRARKAFGIFLHIFFSMVGCLFVIMLAMNMGIVVDAAPVLTLAPLVMDLEVMSLP